MSDRHRCTIFAWRYRDDPEQWEIDAVFLPPAELDKLWRSIHTRDIRLRIIAEEKEALINPTADDFDTLDVLRHNEPRYHGWWRDPRTGLWVAPGQPISAPSQAPPRVVDLACSFVPVSEGWIKLILAMDPPHRPACADRELMHADVWLSDVFDPIRGLLQWMERIWRGEHPRLEIDEEGVEVELHALPAYQVRAKNSADPDEEEALDEVEMRECVRLLVLRCHESSPRVLIDAVIQRQALVRSMYGAFLHAQRYYPVVMGNWPYEGLSCNRKGPLFVESPTLDESLGALSCGVVRPA
jgi:hypothetical protein